jgi:hypothetical protein
MKLEFLDKFSKNNQMSNFMTIPLVGTELFHADGRTDRRDEVVVAFRNFAKAPKKVGIY